MRLRVAGAAVAVAAALLAVPPGAGAATTCELSSGVLDVTMTGNNNTAILGVGPAGEILVSGSQGPLSCAGAPTTTNTNAISVHNQSNTIDNEVTINESSEFAPGLIAEPGDDEIEIFVNLHNTFSSELRVGTADGGGRLVFGTDGSNPNATASEDQPDVDIFPSNVPSLFGFGGAGPDFISAGGGFGTGGPLQVPIRVSGGAGNDNPLSGGESGDLIDGGPGDDGVGGYGGADVLDGGPDTDFLHGGEGNDSLRPGSPGEAVFGGLGTDELSFVNLAAGVSADLDALTTGGGIENLTGTAFADVLRGNAGPNRLWGQGGNDLIEGRGSNDTYDAGPGEDTLEVRDGGPDTADCGADADTVTADRLGIDLLTGCETMVFPATAGGGAGGATGGTGAGDVTPASVTRYRVSRTAFAAASRGPSVAPTRRRKRRRVGTRVRYRLSEPATVRFRVERAARGRRVRGKCRKPSRRNRQRQRCRRYRRLRGSFTHTGRLGRNSFKFTGRLRGRKLRPGRYRLVATATDAAGNRSKPKRVKFRIVKR